MCRHLAYLGPPVTLRALLYDPPHSLVRQSWAPVDMRGGGTVNADGFGVGWYPPGPGTPPGVAAAAHPPADVAARPAGATASTVAAAEPVRYRGAQPIWSDPALPGLAAATVTGAALAAVRSATVGMPVHADAAAPFAEGRWLFSHNGVVRGWPDSVAPLAAELPVRDLLTLDAPTDAALLWALVRHRLRGGADPARAVTETVRAVAAVAPGSRLNLLLTDGRTAVASTAGHALSLRSTPGAVLLASEPLDDDPAWRPVPDGRLVVATTAGVRVRPLDGWAARRSDATFTDGRDT